jgi:hypothetical protein
LHGEPFKHVGRKKELLETLNRVTSAEEPSLHAVCVFNTIALGIDHVERLKVTKVPVVDDHISVLRYVIGKFSEDAKPNTRTLYDFYDTHYNDMNVEAPVCVSMNFTAKKPINPLTCQMPVVQSYVTRPPNPPSFNNTVAAFAKRNWNVPILEDITSSMESIMFSVENMFNCVLKPGWRDCFVSQYQSSPIRHFFDTNADYVNQLAPGKPERFNLDKMLPLTMQPGCFKRHTNILKARSKFPLKGELQDEYVMNATINYHEMEVNALSSSIFRSVIKRLKPWMRSETCMMIEKDRKDIEEFYFRNLEIANKSGLSNKVSLEIDYSKFDKSQLERCAMIKMYVYACLGLDEEFAEYWFDALEESSTYNHRDMIKGFMRWQRRTGTATTAIGNTLITMVTVCSVLFPDYGEYRWDAPYVCAAFLGDDSSIIVRRDYMVPLDITTKLNSWYNLSAKFDIMDHIYFCSSFIVYIPNLGCKMIPDLKKRLLNLTIPQTTDLNEIYISLRDSCEACCDQLVLHDSNRSDPSELKLVSDLRHALCIYNIYTDTEIKISLLFCLVNST